MYQPTPSARNPMTADQLNRLYKRSPSLPPRITLPQIRLVPPVSALVGAAALVLLTPKPTANEDAILRRLKKQEIERKIVTDPVESPKPLPPPFIGGQSAVDYSVTYEFHRSTATTNPLGVRTVGLKGPIESIEARRISDTTAHVFIKAWGRWDTPRFLASGEIFVLSYGANLPATVKAVITSIVRRDGLVDGGNLPTPTPAQPK